MKRQRHGPPSLCPHFSPLQRCAGSSEAAQALQGLLETLLNAFSAAYAAALAAPAGERCAAGLAAHLLSIVNGCPELHRPLLARVEQLVLEAGPAGQLDPQQVPHPPLRLSALCLFLLPPTSGSGLGASECIPAGGGHSGTCTRRRLAGLRICGLIVLP